MNISRFAMIACTFFGGFIPVAAQGRMPAIPADKMVGEKCPEGEDGPV